MVFHRFNQENKNMSNNDNNFGELNVNSTIYKTRISNKFASREKYSPADPGLIVSHIPGTVESVLVTAGSQVKKGDDLLILNAMKMKNRIKCPYDGKVKSIRTEAGARVGKGNVLIEME